MQLSAVLDAQTYRVHFDATPDSEAFLDAALQVLAMFAVSNLLLVFSIELAWKAFLGALLTRYRALLLQVQQFDFTIDPKVTKSAAAKPPPV